MKQGIYRRRLFVAVSFILIICCIVHTKHQEEKEVMLPVNQKIVVLDAGHGGCK